MILEGGIPLVCWLLWCRAKHYRGRAGIKTVNANGQVFIAEWVLIAKD